MARIEKLTPEQSARISEFRNKWLSVGLSTQPTDRRRAETAVDDAYRRAGLEPPRIKVWMASPMAGAYGAEIIKRFVSGDQVWDQVRAQVGDQVRAQVGDQVWDQVRAQVGDQVRAQVGDQVWDQVRAQVGDQVWDQVNRAGHGLHDANWLGFYEFFRDVCGLRKETEKLSGLIDLAKIGCGWWWPFKGAVVLTEKPVSLSRDKQNRLHSFKEAAIRYSDGWGVYAVHGMRVPSDLIMNPERITVARIDGEKNSEIRRVMVEIYGQDRYLKDGNAKLVDEAKDELGAPIRLWRRQFDDGAVVQMVELHNSTLEPDGSRRVYFKGVHPELRPMSLDDNDNMVLGEPQKLTAKNAVASTYGLRGEEYVLDWQT